MQSSAAISVSASSVIAAGPRSGAARRAGGVRVRGFRGEVFACPSLRISPRTPTKAPVARASANGAVAGGGEFDYDLVIICAGVGGHGAALHAVEEVSDACLVSFAALGGTVQRCLSARPSVPGRAAALF
jgi:dihydrolipoamide dehydrogenase